MNNVYGHHFKKRRFKQNSSTSSSNHYFMIGKLFYQLYCHMLAGVDSIFALYFKHNFKRYMDGYLVIFTRKLSWYCVSRNISPFFQIFKNRSCTASHTINLIFKMVLSGPNIFTSNYPVFRNHTFS